jgi:hypothetical protein
MRNDRREPESQQGMHTGATDDVLEAVLVNDLREGRSEGFPPIGRMVIIVVVVLRAERDHFMCLKVPRRSGSNLRGMSAHIHHP